jgi:hypothetical protein
MAVPPDPRLEGPLPPSAPRDPRSPGDLAPEDREQDPAREPYVDELSRTPSRPLTDEEEEAAKHDPGRQPRTPAPASARVPKPPTPGDEELVEEGTHSEETPTSPGVPPDNRR